MVPADFLKTSETLRRAGLAQLANYPAALSAGERIMLYALAYNVRIGNYLEIGTLFGGSALIVAKAFRDSGHCGKLFGVDPCEAASPSGETLAELGENFSQVKGYSPEALERFHSTPQFSLVLIDGDHSWDSVIADFKAVLPLLWTGAIVLFHDSLNVSTDRAIVAAVEQNAPKFHYMGRLCTDPHYENGERWGGFLAVRKT